MFTQAFTQPYTASSAAIACVQSPKIQSKYEAHLDWCRAHNAYAFVGSSHHVFELGVVVFKPAAVHNSGDDIGCCMIYRDCCIKWVPCEMAVTKKEILKIKSKKKRAVLYC